MSQPDKEIIFFYRGMIIFLYINKLSVTIQRLSHSAH